MKMVLTHQILTMSHLSTYSMYFSLVQGRGDRGKGHFSLFVLTNLVDIESVLSF